MILNSQNNTAENRAAFVDAYHELLTTMGKNLQPLPFTPLSIIDPLWMSLPRGKREEQSSVSEAWQFSITGYHNPRVHQGMTVNKFFIVYKKSLAKKKTPKHQAILQFVKENEDDVIRFIKLQFPNTLRLLG